jgi:hypothetical protein
MSPNYDFWPENKPSGNSVWHRPVQPEMKCRLRKRRRGNSLPNFVMHFIYAPTFHLILNRVFYGAFHYIFHQWSTQTMHICICSIYWNKHWIKEPADLHIILPCQRKLIKDGLKMYITIRGTWATDIVINITMLRSWHSSKMPNLSGLCILNDRM